DDQRQDDHETIEQPPSHVAEDGPDRGSDDRAPADDDVRPERDTPHDEAIEQHDEPEELIAAPALPEKPLDDEEVIRDEEHEDGERGEPEPERRMTELREVIARHPRQ